MAKKMKFKDREWLYSKYVEENLSATAIAKICNVHSSSIYRFLKKYNIKKDKKKINKARYDKIKETNIEKYGVENPASLESVKEKIKNTNLKKYGAAHFLLTEEGKSKAQETSLSNWGVEHPMKSEKVKDIQVKSLEEKRGVRHPLQSKDSKKKYKDTMNSRYGGIGFSSEEIKSKIISTIEKRYGVSHPMKSKDIVSNSLNTKIKEGYLQAIDDKLLSEIARENNINRTTLSNAYKNNLDIEFFIQNYRKKISNIESIIIQEFGIEHFNKNPMPDLPYKPDFKLSEKVYLNVDGLYWHSEVHKDKKYHFNMRRDFEEKGLRLIQIREDELYNKKDIVFSIIRNAIGKTRERVYARKTVVRHINQDEASCFLNMNHMMGSLKAKHIGLYNKDSLVSVMSYKVYKDKIKIERFSSKIDMLVLGGLTKLLKAVIREVNKDLPIDYWVDLRYGTGNNLSKFGFVHKRDTLGWKWTDKVNTYNRLKCKANMDERNLSQAEYAEELGWVKIYDGGQRLWSLPQGKL